MKIYDFLEDICNMVKLFCLSLIITFIVFIYYELPFDTKIIYVFLGIIVISYCINSLIRHLPVFVLLHILLFFPPFYIGMTVCGEVISILFLILVVTLDFYLWFFKHDQKTSTIPMACLVIFIGIYLYSDQMDRQSFANASYYLGQFYVIASLANMYLDNTHYLPTEDNDILLNPKKSVLNRNNNYIIGILATILAFNCIIRLSIIEKILSFILSKVGELARFILSLLLLGEGSPATIEEELPNEPGMELPPPGGPNFLIKLLSFLFIAAGICVILYMFYKAVTYIYKLIRDHLNRNFSQSVSMDEDIFEVSEDLKTKGGHHKTTFRFSMDLRERIRKRYLQEIKQQIKHGYDNKLSDTPNERSDQLLTDKKINIRDLTSCYNKARYSEHPITSKEWNHIK